MKQVLIYLINFYRKYFSMLNMGACKFSPTCSEYAINAILKHGAFKGLFLMTWRILKCNPFSKGGIDDVP